MRREQLAHPAALVIGEEQLEGRAERVGRRRALLQMFSSSVLTTPLSTVISADPIAGAFRSASIRITRLPARASESARLSRWSSCPRTARAGHEDRVRRSWSGVPQTMFTRSTR